MFIFQNRQFYLVINFIFATSFITSLQCDENYNSSKDKLVLSPVELIDLITQEERQMKKTQGPNTLVHEFNKKPTEVATTSGIIPIIQTSKKNENPTTEKTN